MLRFLVDLFGSKCSPFVHKQQIIDAYVQVCIGHRFFLVTLRTLADSIFLQYHYLEFVKLYNAKETDTRTMTLVKLHVGINDN